MPSLLLEMAGGSFARGFSPVAGRIGPAPVHTVLPSGETGGTQRVQWVGLSNQPNDAH
jgi:hypothetical protein